MDEVEKDAHGATRLPVMRAWVRRTIAAFESSIVLVNVQIEWGIRVFKK